MEYKYFDIHSHLQFPQYDKDRAEVIARMKEEGIGSIVVGVDKKTSEQAVNLAEKNEHLFASVGLHPNDVFEENFNEEEYKRLAEHGKVIAIGECGLDFYRTEGTSENKEKQKEILRKHINIALEVSKPLMIHCRPKQGTMDAYEELLAMLQEYKKVYGEKLRGNIHFFVGDKKIAQEFFALGFTTSYTAVLTITNDYDEVVANAPIEKLLAETDCPFVAPASHRGKRNEPAFVKEVAQKIADIKQINEEEVRKQLIENTKSTFGLT